MADLLLDYTMVYSTLWSINLLTLAVIGVERLVSIKTKLFSGQQVTLW